MLPKCVVQGTPADPELLAKILLRATPPAALYEFSRFENGSTAHRWQRPRSTYIRELVEITVLAMKDIGLHLRIFLF